MEKPTEPGKQVDRHFKTDHLLQNLGRRALSGGVITTLSQGIRFGLYMVITVVLARLLSPDDFGLVAMALALTQVLQLFREAGLSTATVQQETITHAQVSNLFWANVLVGIACASVGCALAPLLAWYYHDPRLTAITVALSLTLVTGGAAVQHIALLNRQMKIGALALVDTGSMVISLGVALAMAAWGFGYWALVGSQLAAAIFEMLIAWFASGWVPQLPRKNSGTRSMLRFGASLTVATLLRRITSNADTFLLGRYFGAYAVGLYSRGLALIMRPMDQFLVPFDKVFVPVLSRLQNQPDRYRKNFLQIYTTMALVSFPIAGVFLGLSKPLVLVLLGSKWSEVIPIFAAFSLTALFYPVAGAAMWLLTTQRRNRDILISGVAISTITLGSFVGGLAFGPLGVAAGFSLAGVFVRLPIQYYVVGRTGPVTTSDLWKVFLSHLPFWAVVAAGGYAPQLLLPGAAPLAQLALGCTTSLASALILGWGVPSYRREINDTITLLRQNAAKRHAPQSAEAT